MVFKPHAITRLVVYMALACGILAVFTPVLVQFLINTNPVQARLTLEIEKLSGVEFQPDTIKLVLDPLPGILFSDVDLKVNDRLSLTIERTKVSIDLFGVFKQKSSPWQIEIFGPKLIYVPDAPGPPSSVQAPIPALFKIPIEAITHEIMDTLFTLFPNSPNDIKISIKQAKTEFFTTLNARLKIFSHKSGLSFNARIKKIDLSQGQVPQWDTTTGQLIKKFKADALVLTLNLNPAGIVSGNIQVTHPETTMTALANAPLTAKNLGLNFSLTKDLIAAHLVPMDLIYPKADVGIEFNHRPGTGKTNLIFTGKDIDIAQAREVCLPILGGIQVVDILFDILRKGRARDVMVGFKAGTLKNLFDPNNLKLTGSGSSVRVKIPSVPLIVKNVTGQAKMEKGVLHIDAQKGEVRSAQLKTGSLDIDLLNYPSEPFTGRFELKTDLSQLPATLMALLPGTRLATQMALVSEIKGQADGVLELDKPIGLKPLGIRVWAENIQASGRYDPIPLPLRVNKGEFVYDTDLITLKNISGTIGESQIKGGQAQISLGAVPVLSIKQAQALLLTEEFMPWINTSPPVKALLFPVKNFTGPLNIQTIKIDGPMFAPDQWRFELEGGAAKMDIGFADQKFSIRNLSCKFKMDQDSREIQNLGTRIDDITWLRGKIAPDILAAIKMPLFIVDGTSKQKKEINFFQAKLSNPAGPELSFNLAGKSCSDMIPTWLMIKDGTITDAMIIPNPDPDKPQISFNGQLNTSTLEKLMNKGSVLHNKLTSVTKGLPVSVSTDDKSRIHIKADRIDLDGFFSLNPPQSRKQTAHTGRPLLAQKDLVLKSDFMEFRNKTFTRVDTRIFFKPEKTDIFIDHVNLCDLTAMGSIHLFDEKEKTLVTTNFDINSNTKKDISHIFGCLFGSKSIIQGQCNLKGKLSAHDYSDLIFQRQNGDFFFQAKKGRIYKATLLSRVLSVLNIIGNTDINQEGFGFKSLTITANVENSVVHIKKAYIDADDMAIITSGWVDPLNDRLDLTFLVAPFKTVDTIIQQIPLVNTILRGRLASFPAKASGTISDPSVTPLHPSAVGDGLITLFGDLLTAPIRLFTGEKINE